MVFYGYVFVFIGHVLRKLPLDMVWDSEEDVSFSMWYISRTRLVIQACDSLFTQTGIL